MKLNNKTAMRRLVPQEHTMGCGIACVAFVVGSTYLRIHKLDQHPERAWTRGYYCPELCQLLSRFGLDYSWSAVTSRRRHFEIPVGSIVFTKKDNRHPYGHFFVKVSETKYFDPWINIPSIKIVRAGYRRSIGVITHVITPNGK